MRSEQHPIHNQLLAGLATAEFHRLFPHLQLVDIERGEVLYQLGAKMSYVYFPTTATLSIDYVLEDGGTSEITTIGNEGMLGVSLFMGEQTAPNRAVVQLGGYAFRLSATRLMDEFYHKGPLLRLLLRYTQIRLTQISQLAVCNSHHTTEQRLCRWLLQMMDRSHSHEFTITQEAIAAILGVRREAVTEAAGQLQVLGIIKWRRGHVTVLHRAGLKSHVCECYEVVRRATIGLSPPLASAQRDICPPWRQRNPLTTRRLALADRRQPDAHGDTRRPTDDTQAELDLF